MLAALIKLRKDYPVLRHGSLSAPLLLDEHVIVLARQDGDTWALTAANSLARPACAAATWPSMHCSPWQ